MRTVARLGVVAVVVLVAGCTPAAPPARPERSAASPVAPSRTPTAVAAPFVNCDHSIGHSKTPSPRTRVVLGVVALPGFVLSPVRDQDGWLWAKQGLEIRAGATVEIAIAPRTPGQARIGWGSPAEPGPRQVVSGCSVAGCTDDCGWLAFAGGYWVDAPRCLSLIVRAGGREERTGVAVGTACP